MHFTYISKPCQVMTSEEWKSCSELFSNHYGVWSPRSDLSGNRVKLNSKRLQQLCGFHKQCYVVMAFKGSQLIGQCFIIKKYSEEYHGYVFWVTQLVVHSEYRHQRIATKMIKHSLVEPNIYACGIVSSHPFAILSMKKALRIDFDLERIKKEAESLLETIKSPI